MRPMQQWVYLNYQKRPLCFPSSIIASIYQLGKIGHAGKCFAIGPQHTIIGFIAHLPPFRRYAYIGTFGKADSICNGENSIATGIFFIAG